MPNYHGCHAGNCAIQSKLEESSQAAETANGSTPATTTPPAVAQPGDDESDDEADREVTEYQTE